MKTYLASIAACGFCVAGTVAGAVAAAGAQAAAVPHDPPSLSGWRLTLPVDADGGTDGSPEVLDPAALDPPYLARDDNGALDFWAPTVGATTSHSGSPRTELVADAGFATGAGEAHTLSATVTIGQVPATSKTIIVGQIHGDGDLNADPYVLLYYSDGTVHAKVNQQLSSGSNYLDYPLLHDIGIGTTFSYTITDKGDGTLEFTADASSGSEQQSAPVPDAWSGKDVRFQAGDYEQLKGDPADGDGGRIVVAALTAS